MRTVPLGGAKAKGRVALVDDEDYELVSRYPWCIFEGTNPSGIKWGPYASAVDRNGPRQRTILMHKLITGYRQTDHINHNGLDNRRSNLRPATDSQNGANQEPRAGCSSRFKGVCWDSSKGGGWFTLITCEHKRHYLGRFHDEEVAARVYDAAARQLFGEYACLNFPDDAADWQIPPRAAARLMKLRAAAT